jgi:phage terminase large subunit-like protein
MSNLAYRQEIMAEDVDEVPGALWTRATLDKNRATQAPALYRVVVAVDPEATATETSAETGIMVAGKDENEIGYLLEDKTLRGSPADWGATVVRAFDRWRADTIVAETNNGGDMVRFVVEAAAQELHRNGERQTAFVPFKKVHATRGKYVRAEPISTLYENGRVKHVGTFDELEDQLCGWLPGDTSPDRLDAAVWAFTELMLGDTTDNGTVVDAFGWQG